MRTETHEVSAGPALSKAIRRFDAMIGVYARACADGDRDLADDFRQEAWIALWDLDMTRIRPEEGWFVESVIVKAINAAAAREQRAARPERRVEAEGDDELEALLAGAD
jgi:hypothetical protein